MDDEVAVVEEHPGGLAQPLGPYRPGVAFLLQLQLDLCLREEQLAPNGTTLAAGTRVIFYRPIIF